ncbi:MAG: DUF6325 family protein [Actinomycetota bacterium]
MDRIGPVDVLVIEFPRGEVRSQGFATLLDLVERDIIHVLDLEFVRRDMDGSVESVDIADAVADAPEDLGFLVGAASGLLDPDDVAFVGEVIEPGSLAGVLLFEHVWIMPMADAIEAGGARIVTAAHVDPLDLLAVLGNDKEKDQ